MARSRTSTIEGYSHVFGLTPETSHNPLQEAKERLESLVASAERQRVNFLDWSLQIPEPKFGRLNFEAFPFQKDLYSQEMAYATEGVVQKCSQVGASAWLIRWGLFWPDTRQRTTLYVFPHDEQLQKFSHARVAPLIRGSDYLRDRVPHGNINNVYQRQVGYGFFNMAGSQSEAGLESIDADALALDEYDLLVQANVPRAEQRVSGPLSLGLIRRIGFPTIPDYGINAKFNASDKRQWHVKCGACNEWQTLDFFKNVDQVRMTLVCEKCAKPLDVRKGEWVAEYPERDTPGFHLTRLMVPNAKIDKIVEQSKLRKPFEVQEFWNRTLGLPFVPAEGRLSRDAIAAAQSRGGGYTMGPYDLGYSGDNIVTMGIDVASVRQLSVRISEHINETEKRALRIGEVEDFDSLVFLMDAYRVHMAAVDHLPEGRLARAFAERFPGRVVIVSYATQGQKDVIAYDAEQRRVSVRRTEAHDAVIHLVRMKRNLLPLDLPEGYVDHMVAPVRFIERDEFDRVTVTYRATGPDDYFQAEVYDLVAEQCFWVQVLAEEAGAETISTLEDHMEFKRSALTTGEDHYDPGPQTGDDEYRTGMDDEYGPGF